MSMFRAKQTLLLGTLAILGGLASCQLISGLDGLDPGMGGTGGTGGTVTTGGTGGTSATGGSGGEGGEEDLDCGEITAVEPECIEVPSMEGEHCDGECRQKMVMEQGEIEVCEVECDGMDDPMACMGMGNSGTICGPPTMTTNCEITCAGGCQDTVTCPMESAYPCTVFCEGPDGCKDTTINCGDNPVCSVVCSNGGCDETTIINCGEGDCRVRCEDGEVVPTVQDTREACMSPPGVPMGCTAQGMGGNGSGGGGGAGGAGGA